MLKKSLSIVAGSLLVASISNATEIYNNDGNTIAIGGTMKFGYQSTTNGSDTNNLVFVSQDKNKSSKLSITGTRAVNDDMKVFATYEWGINPLATKNDGTDQKDFFTPRQGFAGVDHKTFGKFTFGKQVGVYHDVSAFTEKFDLTGTNGVAPYTSIFNGTSGQAGDGGFTGVGRADGAARYDRKDGPVAYGFQYQAHSTYSTGVVDRDYSAGAVVIGDVAQGLKIGGAFNFAKLDVTSLSGEKVDRMDGILGISYNDDRFSFGLTGSYNTNLYQLLANTGVAPETASIGEEAFFAVKVAQNQQVFIGNNFQTTSYKTNDAGLYANKGNTKSTTEYNYVSVGARNYFTPQAYVSVEYSYDLRGKSDINNSWNKANASQIGAIFRYDF
ncbi:MAG: porin [Alphaproteobacteria bacterium]|nr:porin [Alphaproteobacteria bacterium]